MVFWICWLFFIILCIGRYNIVGHKLMPEKIAFPYVEFLIIFLTCFRFNVGFDWSSYYNSIWPTINRIEVYRFELIPRYFCLWANRLRCPGLLFAFHQIPTLLLLFDSFKHYSKSRYESLLLFFCLFYPDSLSTIRQWLAMAILFYAFKYIKRKSVLKYIFFTVFAFLCHKSSCIAALFVYILYNYIPLKLTVVGCTAILLLANKAIAFASKFNTSYSFYFNLINEWTNNGGNKLKYFLFLLWLFCFIIYFLKKKKNLHIQRLLGIVAVGVICPFLLGGHIGMRIGIYFYFYFVLLVPEILNVFKIQKRVCFMGLIYVYLFLYLFINIHSDDITYIPYRLYFFVNPELEVIN